MRAVPGGYGQIAPEVEADTPDWDAVADVWTDGPRQTLWRRHSDEVNSRLARRWLPGRVGTLLKTDLWDEAMGAGLYPALAERAERVVGVDVSEQIAVAARRRYPELDARIARVQQLPLAAASVGAVVSNSTLDHFPSHADIDESIRELARVLEPGGTLVLTLDNPLNPLVGLVRTVPTRHLNRVWLRVGAPAARVGLAPYHVGATYPRRTLLRVLAETGFRAEEETTLVHSPRFLAAVAGRALERRGSTAAQERFLNLLRSAERLAILPTRFLTGHFYGVRATRL